MLGVQISGGLRDFIRVLRAVLGGRQDGVIDKTFSDQPFQPLLRWT